MNQSLAIALQASSESHGAEKDQKGSLAEGSTGTFKTVLNNPVLPLEFSLFGPRLRGEPKWRFAIRDPAGRLSVPSRD